MSSVVIAGLPGIASLAEVIRPSVVGALLADAGLDQAIERTSQHEAATPTTTGAFNGAAYERTVSNVLVEQSAAQPAVKRGGRK